MKQGKIIDGYEVVHCIKLNAVSHVVAQNTASEDEHYRVYKVGASNGLGLANYFLLHENHDYLNVMREYTRVLEAALDNLDLDRMYRGSLDFDDWVIKTSDCVYDSDKLDFEGQIIAIKSDVLSPEFRSASYQLHIATGGFGCSPTARGQSVHCKNIYDSSVVRFDRHQILGVVVPESIPHWAKDKIAQLREKPSVLDEIKQSKQETQKHPTKPKGVPNKKKSNPEL